MRCRRSGSKWFPAVTLLLTSVSLAAGPIGTGFTYQGQLKELGVPLNGTADFQFVLWDAENGGSQVGSMVAVTNVNVVNGLFTEQVDFGAGMIAGDARWLQISLRSPSGSGAFTPLDARQPITPAPVAAYALAGPGSGGFWATNGDDIYNTNGGDVGIGTTNPTALLHVSGGDIVAADGGNLAVSGGGVVDVMNSLGNPVIRLDPNTRTTTTPILEITGGSDLAEAFDVRGANVHPGMVVVIDVENPGALALSTRAYDRRVAGIISGAGGIQPGMVMAQSGSIADGEHRIALTGRAYCWCDASTGAIEPGDLLTTSDTLGHAMKVVGYPRAQGAIIGKAMTPLKYGRGLVLVLVNLQ